MTSTSIWTTSAISTSGKPLCPLLSSISAEPPTSEQSCPFTVRRNPAASCHVYCCCPGPHRGLLVSKLALALVNIQYHLHSCSIFILFFLSITFGGHPNSKSQLLNDFSWLFGQLLVCLFFLFLVACLNTHVYRVYILGILYPFLSLSISHFFLVLGP